MSCWIIHLIYLTNMVLTIIVVGAMNILRKRRLIVVSIGLEAFFVIMMIFFCWDKDDYGVFENPEGIINFMTLIFLVRNVRLVHYLGELENMRLIRETAYHISSPLLSKFFFIYLVYYLYA